MNIKTAMSTICAASLACACATPLTQAPQVITVEKAVFQPCKAKVPERPEFAVAALPLGSNIENQMRALRIEREQHWAYELALEAVVSGCNVQPGGTDLHMPKDAQNPSAMGFKVKPVRG